MNYTKHLRYLSVILLCATMCLSSPAQDKETTKKDASSAKPSDADMMAMMMELSKPGENHKLLARGVGNWTYSIKMWMDPDPNSKPSESSGTTVTKEVMGGRYFTSEHTGKMQMPGPDGKVMDVEFKGMAVEGYDNAKKKFVSSWIDNMGTGIVYSEGTYDPAAKALTYHAECEMIPGMKTRIREVIKIIDNDHRTFEFYEDRDGKEVRTMEIKYTRKAS